MLSDDIRQHYCQKKNPTPSLLPGFTVCPQTQWCGHRESLGWWWFLEPSFASLQSKTVFECCSVRKPELLHGPIRV